MSKSPKILIVEGNELFIQLYCLNIEMFLGVDDIHVVGNAKEAIKYLNENKDIDIVVTKNTIKTENTSDLIASSLEIINPNIPIIIIGKRDNFGFGASCVEKSLNIKQILKLLAGLLKITANDMMKKSVEKYIKIPVELFKNIYWTNVNLYKIDDNEYIKSIDKNEQVDYTKLTLNINETHIFVYHLDRLSFANHFSAEIISQLSVDEISTKEQILLAEILSDETAIRISKFGLDVATIEQCKKAQNVITSITKDNKNIKGLMRNVLKNKGSYRYRHMQVCSFLSLHILKKMNWSNDEQEKKMSFVSFYQNIYLTKDEHVKITSKEELQNSNLPEDEKLLVLNHAQKASDLVSTFSRIPMGVDLIIKQQHGSLNGVGFSDFYSGNISPLAIIFIIAEQFAHLILRDDNFNYEDAMVEIKSRFPRKRFEKIILALESK